MCQQCILECFGRDNDDQDFIFPLSFDHASGGRIVTSRLPLFQLPMDLCNHILSYLNASALRTLSLVDRDCHTLARTLQFYRSKLTSTKFMDALATEAKMHCIRSRDTNVSGAHLTPIGVCIRRLRIMNVLPDLPNVVGSGLPNLVHISLVDYHAKSRDLLDALARSPGLRHLMMTNFYADTPGEGVIPNPDEELWPSLRSLEVQIVGAKCMAATRLFLDIMRHSGPRLQSLKWAYTEQELEKGHEDMFLTLPDVSLPNLETLALQNIHYQDMGLLDLFFPPHINISALRSLLLTSSEAGLEQQIFRRGRIPALKSFHYHNHTTNPSIITFLNTNYLKTFTMTEPTPFTFIDQLLTIPSLSYLTTLSLVFSGILIPPTSISLLSSLNYLTHLRITVHSGMGGIYWLTPHTELISGLKPLRSLQYLAFGLDGYIMPGNPDFDELGINSFDLTKNNYYNTYTFPPNTIISNHLTEWDMNYLSAAERKEGDRWLKPADKRKAWERWHKEQMIAIVLRYAKAFPELKWCFIGQLPMRVDRNGGASEGDDGVKINVTAEVNRRNDPTFLEYLWKTWGSRIF